MLVDPVTLLLLVAAAFVAGFVDSIAGGGGLISLPALLLAGVAPVEAIATNKLQSTFGTAMSSYSYWKAGLVDPRDLRPAIIATAIGAACGGFALRLIDPGIIRTVIPVLLVAIALYFALAPKVSGEDRKARLTPLAFAIGIAAPIGFYDGMFGPGTGSFFAAGFVALAGLGMLKATASTKVLNLVSNAASLLVFMASGKVIYLIGLAMAAGQILGAKAGTAAAITHGAKLIRPLVVVVTCAVAIKLLTTR